MQQRLICGAMSLLFIATFSCLSVVSLLAEEASPQAAVAPTPAAVAATQETSLTLAELIATSKSSGGGESSGDKDKVKPLSEVVPDATAIDGMIPLYRKKNKLYAEITGSNLNTDYLIAMAIAKGSGQAAIGGYTLGFGDDWLWQFRKVDDRIQVVRRNIRYTADSGTPEAKAVEIAYSDSILYSLPIIAKGSKGGDVIDLDAIFMSDLPKVGSSFGGSFSRDRSLWGNVKGFKNNVEIEVDATYSVSSFMSAYGYGRMENEAAPDSSSTGVTIHYSISKLPQSGYQSRLADDRVGYFGTVVKNFSKNQKDDHFVRYVNRWNLQKADPSAALSPPKKPIVFWIEKTVPFKYRNAVREGILEWNKAYEKVGIVNAIEVRQQSDNDTWDPEDINYNTFRWINSDAGFAMGPSHVNPLNGEILDADIIMDAGFVDSWKRTFDIFIADSMPLFSQNMSKQEQIKTLLGVKPQEEKQVAGHTHEHGVGESQCNDPCCYANHMSQQMAFASLVVALADDEPKEDDKSGEKEGDKDNADADKEKADKKDDEKKDDVKKDDTKEDEAKKDETKSDEGDVKKDDKKDDAKKDGKKEDGKDGDKAKEKKPSPEELKKKAEEAFEKIVLAGIKDVVMHEVGHTLGLRHNFKASSWLTLEEINKPDRSKEFGFAGSVMDYIPLNIMPKGQKQGDYFMATLGPYDYLAIEYGYKPLGGSTEGDAKELRKIAARQSEKGMFYATDEDTYDSPDPLTNRFDLGANPIDYAKVNVQLYHDLLPGLIDRSVKDGDNFADVGYFFEALLFKNISANRFLARNIGGLYINRDHKGDPSGRPPVQVVDAKTQRESLAYVCSEVFGNESFKIPAELYNQFGSERWMHWGSSIGRPDYSLRDTVVYAQLAILRTLINPDTLNRMVDAELRVADGEDILTVNELFDTLTGAIFRELDSLKEGEYSAKKPAVNMVRRNVQEYYFLFLSEYAGGELAYSYALPEACQAVARQELTRISSNIQGVLSGKAKLDPSSKAHLQNLNERIKKVLEANLIRMMP